MKSTWLDILVSSFTSIRVRMMSYYGSAKMGAWEASRSHMTTSSKWPTSQDELRVKSKGLVVKIDFISIENDVIVFNMRLRGEKNWLFYENLAIQCGGSVSILDGCEEEAETSVTDKWERTEMSDWISNNL